MELRSGIYKIQSKIKPEKLYIGSAIQIKSRWALHIADLRKNQHHASKLQNHYNKYGEDDLVFTIIEPCLPPFLVIQEQHYIDKLKPFFNSRKRADSLLGYKWSKESKDKLSKSCKGKIPWNKGLKGIKRSEEFKRKRSEYMKGNKLNKGKHWKWTEEQLEKLRGENNHFYGKHHTEESKKKRMRTIRQKKVFECGKGS